MGHQLESAFENSVRSVQVYFSTKKDERKVFLWIPREERPAFTNCVIESPFKTTVAVLVMQTRACISALHSVLSVDGSQLGDELPTFLSQQSKLWKKNATSFFFCFMNKVAILLGVNQRTLILPAQNWRPVPKLKIKKKSHQLKKSTHFHGSNTVGKMYKAVEYTNNYFIL